jgi:hypothetical protein
VNLTNGCRAWKSFTIKFHVLLLHPFWLLWYVLLCAWRISTRAFSSPIFQTALVFPPTQEYPISVQCKLTIHRTTNQPKYKTQVAEYLLEKPFYCSLDRPFTGLWRSLFLIFPSLWAWLCQVKLRRTCRINRSLFWIHIYWDYQISKQEIMRIIKDKHKK